MSTTAKLQHFIKPDWPAPDNVVAWASTRQGGVSLPPYSSLNPAAHVGDAAASVQRNRQIISQQCRLPAEPAWLKQTHSTDIVELPSAQLDADGATTTAANCVCVVQTADCLPLLLCDQAGQQVAAIHAGWRGLAAGIVEQAVSRMQAPPQQLLVWLGPAISGQHFEVGAEVYAQFVARHSQNRYAFVASERPQYYMADLYQLARNHLQAVGVTAIYGGQYCSYADPQRFYSYRRDGVTGRMASLIYRKA
ncbi:peptidoglycan editing factor PgeF [Dasania marina]|uniref:peptidoglycan editing factor PgeF n=1 Tax=Dasania marina TaxID=471499 RepID=UPI0003673DBA|nr:peptidoglycan editing factor PgeF [Dasania marina]